MGVETALVVAQTGHPVYFADLPGIGKTSTICAIADAWSVPCILMNVAHYERSDINGIPIIIHELGRREVVISPPSWARRAAERPHILFMDEITNCNGGLQSAVLTILSEKRVGLDLMLHPDTIIIVAGNPPEYAANGFSLSAPMANRLFHFKWDLSDELWLNMLLAGEFSAPVVPKLPDNWRDGVKHARATIGAFLLRRRELVMSVPEPEKADGPFPTRRTWTNAADAIAACRACGLSADAEFQAVAAAVGAAAAAEFADWLSKLDLPDPEDMLRTAATAKSYKWPREYTRLDQAYVMMINVAHAVVDRFDTARYAAFDKIALAAHNSGYAEAVAVALRIILAGKPEAKDLMSNALASAMYDIIKKAKIG